MKNACCNFRKGYWQSDPLAFNILLKHGESERGDTHTRNQIERTGGINFELLYFITPCTRMN